MTGCPYGLIYSASQTFDRLRAQGAVQYTPGVLATRIGQDDRGPFVYFKNLASGQFSTIHAERVFVACGGIGSTRLVIGSLPNAPTRIEMPESIQFAVPFLSARSTGDPRTQNAFTLNQFNVLISFDSEDYHTSHIHCYPYNPAVLAALPDPLRNRLASPVTAQMLGRLTIGLGYLPSWASPTIPLSFSRSSGDNLPRLTIGSDTPVSDSLMLREVMKRLHSVGRFIDLHPVTPAMRVSASAKSYHFGGSIPHSRDPEARALASDTLGRVPGWDRIHLVDGAVLPSVPATTFTFTVMANAHRIASAAVSGAAR
jgi:hypothetical protein